MDPTQEVEVGITLFLQLGAILRFIQLSILGSPLHIEISKSNTNEIQQRDSSNSTRHNQIALNLRNRASQMMFGWSIQQTQQWPGLLPFYASLEGPFDHLMREDYDIIWNILGRNKPTQPYEVWHWCFAILAVIFDHAARGAADPMSLESIYRSLVRNTTGDTTTKDTHGKRRVLRAIFATLCWLSLALKPVFTVTTPEQNDGHSTSNEQLDLLRVEDTLRTVSLDQFSKRPLEKLFRSFHIPPREILSEPSNPYGLHNGTLHASSVNFHSLKTISRLRVIWVDTLAAHLAWNQQEHTVSIFRFPSACVMHIKSKKQIGALSRYISA